MNETQLQQWLISWISAHLDLADEQALDIDTPLLELGLASRDAVMLAGELEDRLDRTIEPTLAWERPTIRALVAELARSAEPVGPAAPPAPSSGAAHGAGVPVPQRTAEPVAIIGMACRFPGGVDTAQAFWDLLDAGTDAVGSVPDGRWHDAGADGAPVSGLGGFLGDVSGFDADYFGISPREATLIDPQQRLLLELAVEAVQHARIDPAALRGTDTGVYVGISSAEYGHLTTAVLDDVEPWTATGAALSIAANRVSYALDLRGPSIALDTACSSSLVALHQACLDLRAGNADAAVVGGVNLLLTPLITASFERGGALAPDGRCKPFGADADGIGRGEGCGVLLLKRLGDAQAAGDRILAVVAGSAVNSDGRSNGLTAPNPAAQRAVLARACANAGIDPSTVDYVEAHGTGTPLGDPIEANALGAVYGRGRPADRPLLIGSVKSNIGHLEAAAGIAGVIKVVLALGTGRLPASLHAEHLNPAVDFAAQRLQVVSSPRSWPRTGVPARAGVSGFGFGGTNAHVVLEQAPATAPVEPATDLRAPVLALAADSDERVIMAAHALADWLEHGAGRTSDLHAVARSLQVRSECGARRVAVAAADRAGAIERLRAVQGGRAPAPHADAPVFVFAGYGQHWAGMGRRLLPTEPAFAATVDELRPLLIEHAGVDVRTLLADGAEPVGVLETMVAIFAVQVALAALWRASGVEPAAVIGQSLGEVAAAVVSGSLTLADGARVISVRARLLAGVEQRAVDTMALLGIDGAEFDSLAAQYPDVSVAVFSAPDQIVVGGERAQVERLVDAVSASDRQAWPLNVGGAGHTAAVDPIIAELLDDLADVRAVGVGLPFYSTVRDDPRSTPAFDAPYWAANVRRPVRFTQAVAAAAHDGFDTFIEISAHPVAAHALTATLSAAGVPDPLVVGSLRRDVDDAVAFATNLGELHAGGHPTAPDVAHLDVRCHDVPDSDVPNRDVPNADVGRSDGAQVDLPPGPWKHRRYWYRSSQALPTGALPTGLDPTSTALGQHVSTGATHIWTAPAEPFDRLDLSAVLALCAQAAGVALPGAQVRSAALDATPPAATGARLIVCAPDDAGAATLEVFADGADGWVRVARAELVRAAGSPLPAAEETAASVTAASVTAASVTAASVTAASPISPAPVASEPAAIVEQLRARLGEIMGYDPSDLDQDVPLTDLGLDSLMGLRAQHAVQRDFGVPLPVRLLLQGLTLSGLATHICTARDLATIAVPAAAPAPAPTAARVPPRDPAERLLVGLCADVLGRPAVGMTEDVFGGDETAAHRLAAAIGARVGRTPATAKLLAAGTLERIADLVRPDLESDTGSPVRTLRSGGDRRPLFLFHPAGATTTVYQPLVARLDADVPVYGMERLPDLGTVEDKATRYLELMREIQPTGPYRLLGWSLGGVLAYEIAHQLGRVGERCEFLASIDTILPLDDPAGTDEAALLTARYERFAEHVSHTYGADVHLPPDIGRHELETQMALVHEAMVAAGVRLPDGVLTHQYTSYVDARIAEAYQPLPYAAPMTLYRAREAEALTTSLDPRYLRTDETLGWDATVRDLEVVRVPGDHISMIDPPNVDVLVAHLRQRLADLDTRTPLVASGSGLAGSES